MSSLLFLVLELVVLRLAKDICSSLVRFLIATVLSLTVLRVVNRFVSLWIRKEVRNVPNVGDRVVVLVLSSLSIDVAHFLLIIHGVVSLSCSV